MRPVSGVRPSFDVFPWIVVPSVLISVTLRRWPLHERGIAVHVNP